MDVTYVADSVRIGGAERYLADIARGVRAAGHRVTVVAPQDDVLELVRDGDPAIRAVRAGSAAYVEAPSGAARARALASAGPAMARAVGSADVVHVNNGGYPGSDLCRLVPILRAGRGARRVMSVHSIPWERGGSRVQATVDSLLWRSLSAVGGATEVVHRALVDERGMPDRLFRRTPYGMPPPAEDEAGALRAELAPEGTRLLVGMVAATADPGKGHTVLRDAVEAAGQDVRAVMVGAAPGLEHPRVTIAGRVPSVGPYLRAIDALVVPSTTWESLPLVILEAMAAGKPVFGSRLAGIPEAIAHDETGVLFAPGDATALGALLRDADPDTLARMGEAGRARWEREFSPERMVQAVLDLYAELALPGA